MKPEPGKTLPDPLRGSEIPSFTHYSIVVRLPEIGRRVLADNDYPPKIRSQIESLLGEIPYGKIRPIEVPSAQDQRLWQSYVQPYLGMSWLQPPWFFIEAYFYMRILEATGYFLKGNLYLSDPFARQKQLGLETTLGETRILCQHTAEMMKQTPDHLFQSLKRLLRVDLWGNQNDLSLWPASASDEEVVELRDADEHLLADETGQALDLMASWQGSRKKVDFFVDNAGFELVCDLALADVLLSRKIAAWVVFHVKPQPVFVSDAMEKDVIHAIQFLAHASSPAVRAFGDRLSAHLEENELVLHTHPFWVSPHAMWEMPAHLRTEFGQSSLVLCKGDAHYRRLLGDRHWPISQPFSEIVDYMPAPVLALRTLKSEVACGLKEEVIPRMDHTWMTNGKWGVIQFAPGPVES